MELAVVECKIVVAFGDVKVQLVETLEATVECERPTTDPECPGQDCAMCSGEACWLCGAGCWSHEKNCEHDVLQRHEQPDSIGRPLDLRENPS